MHSSIDFRPVVVARVIKITFSFLVASFAMATTRMARRRYVRGYLLSPIHREFGPSSCLPTRTFDTPFLFPRSRRRTEWNGARGRTILVGIANFPLRGYTQKLRCLGPRDTRPEIRRFLLGWQNHEETTKQKQHSVSLVSFVGQGIL